MKQLHLNYRLPRLINSVVACRYSSDSKFVNKALGGKTNYEKDFRDSHIETSYLQKILLGLGSGFMSITDPRRGDMVAVMGESTGVLAFEYIRSKMLQSEEGRKILEEKPRISSSSVDLDWLKQMPEGTLGKAYSNFLERYKYSPDERLNVRFVDDMELAYVATRYREAHDLFHTILDMPTNMLGEVTVKWVEAIQTKLPMCVTGAFFGPLRLAPKFSRTYSTSVVATLDSDVHDGIKNGKFNAKKFLSIQEKYVEIPLIIEDNIISILEKNDCLKNYKECEKLKNDLYRRTLPVEGPRKQYLLTSLKNKLLMKFAIKPPKQDVNEVLTQKLIMYNKNLDNLKLSIKFNKHTGLLYLMSRAAYEYGALVKIFKEISTKDPEFKPSALFDFGSGVGTVIWAANRFWENSIIDYMTVDVSAEMNDLAHSIIHPNRTVKPLVKNLVQKQYFPPGDMNFDIVVSAFTFFELGNYGERMNYLASLWNKTSNYLVLVENGTKDGFQIIKDAREMILQQSNSLNFKSHVVAPCPHDFICPMSTSKSANSCRFLSKYKELNLRNRDCYAKTPYSYVIFKKESRNKNDQQWPRIVTEVLFQKRRVIFNCCTEGGHLKQVLVSKGKYDAETYKCAKALKWGGLFPGKVHNVEKRTVNEKDANSQEEMIQKVSADKSVEQNETVEKE